MRQKINLDGSWKFRLDPSNQGETESWYSNGIPEPINVTVPHIWQREGDHYVTYNGAAWYEKNITIDNVTDHYYLCFGAVDYKCRVWWNGEYVGEHEGGFTPFEFLIPPSLVDTENSISVRVYDYEANAEIPIGKQGSWYTRVSGIWQSVFLETRPSAYTSNIFVTPKVDEQTIEIKALVNGDITNDSIIEYVVRSHSLGEEKWVDSKVYTGTLQNCDMEENLLSYIEGHTSYKAVLNAEDFNKWSPENPYLYEVEIRVGEDAFTSTFGYRKVEQKHGRIYVNDEPVYIRGALDQAFYPDTIYTVPSIEYIKKEIRLAKVMGFNLLRKHIKAELPEYLYWADRLGMLIWAEPPNYVKWTKPAQNRFIKTLKEMLIRDYNHPSIIIWSIYNEEWGLEWDLEFDKDKQAHVEWLFDTAKKWDKTRLFCDNSGWTHVKTDINDHHRYFALPEQLNEWEKDLDDYIIGNQDQNYIEGYKSYGEPLIVSEFGMWGLPSLEKLKDFYKGNEPWWFVNQGDGTHQDDYKKPTTALQNHCKFGIQEALGDFESLAVLSQKRMFRGVKSTIEEMRKRPQIGGYVVTEFTDIEWETNGWIDFMREPKEGFERLIDFNGPTCVLADISVRNLWSGEVADIDVIVIDDHQSLENVSINWKLVDMHDQTFEGSSGTIVVEIAKEGFVKVSNGIQFKAPDVQGSNFALLKMLLVSNGEVVASNQEELTITSKIEKTNHSVFIHHLANQLSEKMKRNGINVSEKLDENAIVVTDHLDDDILRHIHSGGHAIFLAEDGDSLGANGQYTFRELDPGESWARASSMNYVNTSIFEDIPLHAEVGWEAQELHPDYVIPFSDYKKVGKKRTVNMFGYPRLAEESTVISGYFQGWLGQNGGSIVHHSDGKGSIMIVTWKLKDHYGNHPIATQIMHSLLKIVKGDDLNED